MYNNHNITDTDGNKPLANQIFYRTTTDTQLHRSMYVIKSVFIF